MGDYDCDENPSYPDNNACVYCQASDSQVEVECSPANVMFIWCY